MFLVDSALAADDWDGINDTVKKMLEKAEAEIVSIRKWDERKLAYEIRRKPRGTYILAYFKADGSKISQLERDVVLSEKIMRALILNAEQQTAKDIEKETPTMLAERHRQEHPQDVAGAAEEPAETGRDKRRDAETDYDADRRERGRRYGRFDTES
jgi:small subunit ribosomal protein S6